MVYCVTCGTKNPDDAQVCTNCGRQLYATSSSGQNRRVENECLGIPHGGIIVGLAIGIIILLAGAIVFLQQAQLISETVSVWPFVLIIFGILIVIGAVLGMRRRY